MRLIRILPLIMLLACQNRSEKTTGEVNNSRPEHGFSNEYLVADTIIYDVIIKNADPEDTWQQHSLKRLNSGKLIDYLFEAVYEKNVSAIDYFTNKKIDPRKLRSIEKEEGFSRDMIGKIQFTESWYYNPARNVYHKKILSVVIGYETYDSDTILRGYKPVFKIDFE